MPQAPITPQQTGDILWQYLIDITPYKPLSPEDERMLWETLEKTRPSIPPVVIRHICHAYLHLVVSIAKQYQSKSMPLLDCIQEGNLGLLEAIGKYDPSRGEFSTCATWWIRKFILQSLADKSRTVRLPTQRITQIRHLRAAWNRLCQQLQREPTEHELGEELGFARATLQTLLTIPDPMSLEHAFENNILDSETLLADELDFSVQVRDGDLLTAIQLLLPREQFVIVLRFGFLADQPKRVSYVQIGKALQISRQRAREIETTALQKIKRSLTGNSSPQTKTRRRKPSHATSAYQDTAIPRA